MVPHEDVRFVEWKQRVGVLVEQRFGVGIAELPSGPAEELVSEADPRTLLVVAQVGHSTLERLLFGSTAARVVRLAPCDVLVVRTEKTH